MLNYTLLGLAYTPSAKERTVLQSIGFDWSHQSTAAYKTNLKRHILLHQLDRCAYCRKIVEADGYYEPLEHIVAQSKKPEWVFIPTNLIVTCDRCNNLKGAEQTLTDAFEGAATYPANSSAFRILNPYFDSWGDHLTYENDIFIVPVPGTKGEDTIRICKLYKYNVIINRAKELKLGHKEPLGRSLHRLKDLDKSSATYNVLFNELVEAMDHFKERVEDKFI